MLRVAGDGVQEGVVLLDAELGEFAALADVPSDGSLRALAMSPLGTHVLFLSIEDNGRTVILKLQDLATGRRQPIPAPPGCFDSAAAISPDGQTIAALCQDEHFAFIDIVEIATHIRRRIWSGDGGASMGGTSISWSPHARMIVATYHHAPTDELATVVIDASSGTAVAHYEYRLVLGVPNGTWVDKRRVVLIDEVNESGPTQALVDVLDGHSQQLAVRPVEHRLAIVNGQSLVRIDEGDLYLTGLDGEGSEPFLAMSADLDIRSFDIAAGLIQ
jgi:hypothetical protein